MKHKNTKQQRQYRLICISLISIIIIAIGMRIQLNNSQKTTANEPKTYQAIQKKENQRYDHNEAQREQQLKIIQKQIQKDIDKDNLDVSVAFYDLTLNKGFTINEDMAISTNEALYMPTALLVAEQVDKGTLKWQQTLTHTTLKKAVTQMLEQNDHQAYDVLVSQLGGQDKLIQSIDDHYQQGVVTKSKKLQLTADQLVKYMDVLYNQRDTKAYQYVEKCLQTKHSGFAANHAMKWYDFQGEADDTYYEVGCYLGAHPFIIGIVSDDLDHASSWTQQLGQTILTLNKEN